MNHKQLTKDLFQKHFPEWLNEAFVEEKMQQTREAFEKRGVKSFYNSITPEAKKERWEWREKKINERKQKSIPIKTETNQLNLF
jgi:hypothetical protein